MKLQLAFCQILLIMFVKCNYSEAQNTEDGLDGYIDDLIKNKKPEDNVIVGNNIKNRVQINGKTTVHDNGKDYVIHENKDRWDKTTRTPYNDHNIREDQTKRTPNNNHNIISGNNIRNQVQVNGKTIQKGDQNDGKSNERGDQTIRTPNNNNHNITSGDQNDKPSPKTEELGVWEKIKNWFG